MDVDLEASVITSDGKHVGKVSHIVVDPRNNKVLDLIVHRHRGVLDVRDIVVPMSAVKLASKAEVQLDLSAAQLERLSDFVVSNYTPPPPEWFVPVPYPPGGILWPAGFAASALFETEERNLPVGSVTVSEGTEAFCPDGRVGVVDEVVSDPNGTRVVGFVLRLGSLLPHRVFVPVDWVAAVNPDRLLMNRTKPEVERLQERATE